MNYTAFLDNSSSPQDKSPTKHSILEIPTLSDTEGIVIFEYVLFWRSADLKSGDFLVKLERLNVSGRYFSTGFLRHQLFIDEERKRWFACLSSSLTVRE